MTIGNYNIFIIRNEEETENTAENRAIEGSIALSELGKEYTVNESPLRTFGKLIPGLNKEVTKRDAKWRHMIHIDDLGASIDDIVKQIQDEFNGQKYKEQLDIPALYHLLETSLEPYRTYAKEHANATGTTNPVSS